MVCHTDLPARGLALPRRRPILALLGLAATHLIQAQAPAPALRGHLRDSDAQPLPGATLTLTSPLATLHTTTGPSGAFSFPALPPAAYTLSVTLANQTAATAPLPIPTPSATLLLTLTPAGTLLLSTTEEKTSTSGGEQLSSKAVSEIPLNKRDFGQLLLLAAGTASDSSGANNFTQQFAINGQRGVEATFALDGADSSDPELGGATFSNFNVDAVLELQSISGVMPADIGRGAAGFTNILTRSGTDALHGSVFEFLRNSSLDARNYFDYPSPASPGRIPPFRRNEFGFTNGGPVLLPHLYNGRGRTFYFLEYQGFRQVLGTTQVFSVPTAAERSGLDTTAFPGDTLTVPVDPSIAPILARYPLPNLPGGTFGIHTYATSSKVKTNADQFSFRLDQQLGDRDHIFARISFDNLDGPTTNPDQTAIDPTFGVEYVDRQRNGVLTWVRTVSPRLTLESSLSATRTTPSFPTPNRTDPAVKFNDGLFEPFNTAGGSVIQAFTNLFQARETVSLIRSSHALRFGAEVRLNRDTTYFGISPNGEYDFGGGTAFSPVLISSASGQHNILPGDPLPDTLSGLLTGSPFAYTVAVAPAYSSSGSHIGPAAVNRNAVAAFLSDTWKLSPRFTLVLGLRFELYTPIAERARRTSGFYDAPGGGQQFLINPHPTYRTAQNTWAPRVQLDTRLTSKLTAHLGGSLTTIPPNIWQDNFLTGALPYVFYPRLTAALGARIPFGFQVTPAQIPAAYTPTGVNIFDTYRPNEVPANTVLDVERLVQDLADLSPSHTPTPLNVQAVARNFGNALLGTWSIGLDRSLGPIAVSAAYVGTSGIKLPRVSFPNAYPGATARFAPFTQFNSTGAAVGGFGTEQQITATSHSSYNALQLSAQGVAPHGGPGLQASYTWSKSIDDVSSVAGTSPTSTIGAVAPALPQNPFDTHAERGPSNFDLTHSFTLSLAQDLPLRSMTLLQPLNRKLTDGWQLISISSISSGSPFTVYSGLQQTGAGSMGADRPDQVAKPHLTTSRRKREDYFGLGDNNASFFSIPVNLPGGTGPNRGRFGTLGRNTFRGPAFYDFDFSLVKDTPVGHRRSGSELVVVQFRSEFFNIFNIVNMGLPSNTIRGTGFGEINRTAGNSRQIQFSLKLAY